jgi:hypothetical protein
MRCDIALLCALFLSGCNGAAALQNETNTEQEKSVPEAKATAASDKKADAKATKPDPLPRSDAACAAGANTQICQTADFNGDGKEDRIYIAEPGNFSVLNPIYENDELGEGVTTPLDFRQSAIVIELGGMLEDYAINLEGAATLQRLSSDSLKSGILPANCATETDKAKILATGEKGKIMIAIDGQIVSARRC